MSPTHTTRMAAATAATAVALAAAGAFAMPAAATASTAAAASASTGYVRLAHLSPDTPAVDVYLTSLSGAVSQQVFPGVGYGVVSAYLPLPAGSYTVAMRGQGATPTSPPVLSASVTVVAGDAYTVAGVGRYADLGLRVIDDDLSAPDEGSARVRVVQASVRDPLLKISIGSDPAGANNVGTGDGGAAGGPAGEVIADQVAFATTTDYLDVSPGEFDLSVQPLPFGMPTLLSVELDARSVYSLLILDGADGRLAAQLRIDSRNGAVVPAGGVETGGGGTASSGSAEPIWWVAGAAALAVIALVVLVRRRRRRSVATHW